MRVAAIDIGSNSIRLTIVDVPVAGRRIVRDEEKAYARLGHGVLESGRLACDAMDTAVEALDRMMRLAREREVTHVRAVATAAVRQAANGAAFVERVRREVGLEIDVIDGAHEGRLALLSAADGLALDGDIAVVDIGGGSVEIARGTGSSVIGVVSMPLGAVVLADRFGGEDPMSTDAVRRLTAHVRQTLSASLPDTRTPGVLAGSGGTVTTLASMLAARRGAVVQSVHGSRIPAGDLAELREILVRSSARDRERMKGLAAARIDLIVPGVVVLAEVLCVLGADSVLVNARGMREGIVLEVIERERGPLPAADRMRSVRELGGRYRYDAAHAEHVRWLAMRLFDDLAPGSGLVSDDRPLLEAAALLHDVGHHVAYEAHHKHSYHLISHAEIPGFTSAETRLIAAIARYHKGALPKARHEAVEGLDDAALARVTRLAAVLRIADGLDRTQGQRVGSVRASRDGDRLTLAITGRPPLDIERDGALRKADLAEALWGVTVHVEVAADLG